MARQGTALVPTMLAFEDLPEGEVARLLGVSVGTVKSGTSRALTRLRAELGPMADDLARHTDHGKEQG